jgi:hypothetical protein
MNTFLNITISVQSLYQQAFALSVVLVAVVDARLDPTKTMRLNETAARQLTYYINSIDRTAITFGSFSN